LGFADAGLQGMKNPNAGKLSDEELDRVGAGRVDTINCPICKSDDIFWNNGIGFWVCVPNATMYGHKIYVSFLCDKQPNFLRVNMPGKRRVLPAWSLISAQSGKS
jgi:hypothetical protein